MATKKITDLSELTSAASGDVLPIVDVDLDITKKITTANLLSTKQDTITGAASTITGTDLTVSRALTSSATGKVEVSAVTSTELGYLDGVTSAVQTQLDGKLDEYDGTTYDVTALAAVTQAEYDAIGTKSATTLYFII